MYTDFEQNWLKFAIYWHAVGRLSLLGPHFSGFSGPKGYWGTQSLKIKILIRNFTRRQYSHTRRECKNKTNNTVIW